MGKRDLRIIVCGGRHYADRDRLYAVLDRVLAERGISQIITGGACGADDLALAWSRERGVPCEVVRAKWGTYGRAAGPIRNGEMLKLSPDGVIAFLGGAGTADMVRQAEAAGVPVWRIDWG